MSYTRMSRPFLAFIAAVALVAPASVAGQAERPESRPRTALRTSLRTPLLTSWGHPDLQGIWDFATITPLERPKELAGKEVLTAEEALEFEQRTLQQRNPDRRDGGAQADVGRAYNRFWWDFGTSVVKTRQTSLIVDPADGRIPPLTAEGQKRADARAVVRQRAATGPEDRNLWERCIMGANAGPPMVPGPYNNFVQLFQTPEYVVIFNEMINDARVVKIDNARVVPLGARPHLPPNIRLWKGNSRGHWEGATLVVDSANFRDESNFRGASASLHLVERFTRLDADTLLYEFTVNDPVTWTRPWSARIPMRKSEGPIFEYACHEGNYGMFNMLTGARAEEEAAEGTAKR